MKLITKIALIVVLAFAFGSCTKFTPLEKKVAGDSFVKKTFSNGENDGNTSITDPENEDDIKDADSKITDPENEDDIEDVN